MSLRFVAFDTETTGLWAPVHNIVEIGAVAFSLEGDDTENFQTLVNPGRKMPPEVIRIHGITDDMVAGAPPAPEALAQFFAFCGDDSVLIAHNAMFDISFLAAEIERAQIAFPSNPVLDTVQLYHKYLPGLPSYSLESLSIGLGLTRHQEHRALSDALLVMGLIRRLADSLGGMESREAVMARFGHHFMADGRIEEAVLPDEFDELRTGIANRSRIEIEYESTGKPPTTRVIQAKRIMMQKNQFYLFAYCELAEADRTFRLDRILRYRVLDK